MTYNQAFVDATVIHMVDCDLMLYNMGMHCWCGAMHHEPVGYSLYDVHTIGRK